ncbi:AAA family ATPase [Chloroflexota bacterium]
MAINKIKLSNFKSFRDLELELGNFNVIIGANASGKSNFIQIFRFLRDTMEFGLESAISMQGGVEYFRNINIGASERFSVEINSNIREPYMTAVGASDLIAYECLYKFTLDFMGSRLFEVAQEQMLQKLNIYKKPEHTDKTKREKIGKGEIFISRNKREANLTFKTPKKIVIDTDAVFQIFTTQGILSSQKKPKPKSLLIEEPLFLVGYGSKRNLGGTSIYDLDPKSSKRSQKITGKAELEEDGSNLALILQNILKSSNDRKRLLNLIRNLLPFVDAFHVQTFADKSLMLKVRESYTPVKSLPASFLSDGTINIAALVVALYFSGDHLKIIEEPGRNIHPHLISRIIEMMKEASKQNQIIVTTHNPEIVRYADVDNILLVSRDKYGYSHISKPAEKKEIQAFLENEMGIDELYVQNILGI